MNVREIEVEGNRERVEKKWVYVIRGDMGECEVIGEMEMDRRRGYVEDENKSR